ncbi:Uncharacterized protein BP5553_05208 [Venustampulla echinocandica]|uniref:Mediator of RNA polymerase II transcription subunit 18 n=1 Tax=Venustampulla echinocandica TaxID=2656787 RepID=A0A370TQG8_9HELO|nr:Uncharacterized protein BP5553_05208 [Venustampulla echinocandica]RDL37775.1 Uncharacterized protein BP5553_05208 [Venustampulla echinocandica]
MHELFLTAHIGNDALHRAVRILQGYCAMQPQHHLYRRLMFEGPKARTNLKGLDPAFIMSQPPAKINLWRGLHEQLLRQSYVITLIYEVDGKDFGKAPTEEPGQDVKLDDPARQRSDIRPGTLRWNELPDPAGTRPVNTRLMLQIDNERDLITTTQSQLGYSFSRQFIHECYRFVHGNAMFELSRYLQLPEEGESTQPEDLLGALPPFESLTPFDGEDKWILTISAKVLNGNDPDQMQQGIGELMTIKTEFEGCFDFHTVARHTLDTRLKVENWMGQMVLVS